MLKTEEQNLIIDAAKNTEDNLLVSALAGAAKTTTLCMIAEALPKTAILALCFNRRIATEMQERLPGNCQAMTLNSLGHRVWSDAIGRRLRIEPRKNYAILKELVDGLTKGEKGEAYKSFSDTLRAVEFSKSYGFIPDGAYSNAKRLAGDNDFFASLEEEPSELQCKLIRLVSKASLKQAWEGLLDFDDQILMPTVFPTSFPRYPLVLVDEAQDLSNLNHATLRKLAKKRLIAVGDECQCQPSGTLVSVVRQVEDRWHARIIEQVPIELVQTGDKLVGYDTQYSEFMFNREVLETSQRDFSGRLIKVISMGGVSRYTPEHKCLVNYDSLRSHTALYVMRKGSRWRVGIAAMSYAAASGPCARARAEGADAMWILATFRTRREALQAEAAVQAAFGIPDITFEWAGMQTQGYADKESLEQVWKNLEEVDFADRAFELLRTFNRDIKLPLWKDGYFSLKRPMVVNACNILNGCEVLPFSGYKKRERRTDWVECEVRYEEYTGVVYSLKVSHTEMYIADGLVTHNSIYGFRGAHEDSMNILKVSFTMSELKLTVSFRCPQMIVTEARWRAPEMQWPEWAALGEVRTLQRWSVGDLPDVATILCRNNAPLFHMAIELLKNERYPQLVGSDLGKNLIKTLTKLGPSGMRTADVLNAIATWEDVKLKKSRTQAKVRDQAECLRIFARQGANLGEAIAYAEHVLTAKGPITLSTIHKAKGLEWGTVFILDKFLIDLTSQQDRNLLYVAQTRSKEKLYYVDSAGFVGNDAQADRQVEREQVGA